MFSAVDSNRRESTPTLCFLTDEDNTLAPSLISPVEQKQFDRGGTRAYAKRSLQSVATWLYNAHKKLDVAVFAAYGWPVDLSDDEILARLLALNLERAKQQK